ncbi:MAG: hypothetical protein JO100_06345 [Pseudonocardia sp.]|nr:hypothetical protein [Pseudonocardia sp.]
MVSRRVGAVGGCLQVGGLGGGQRLRSEIIEYEDVDARPAGHQRRDAARAWLEAA